MGELAQDLVQWQTLVVGNVVQPSGSATGKFLTTE
jgi:hypothetical protein